MRAGGGALGGGSGAGASDSDSGMSPMVAGRAGGGGVVLTSVTHW